MTGKYYEWLQEPTVNEMEQAWESINEEIQECRQNDNTEQVRHAGTGSWACPVIDERRTRKTIPNNRYRHVCVVQQFRCKRLSAGDGTFSGLIPRRTGYLQRMPCPVS